MIYYFLLLFLIFFENKAFLQDVEVSSSILQNQGNEVSFQSDQSNYLSPSPVLVQVMSSHLTVVPGQKIEVAILLSHQKDWHTYWVNPGDIGSPTFIEWDLVDGVCLEPLIWPVPETFESMEFISYGYSSQVILKQTFLIPSSMEAVQNFVLKGRLNWLACNEVCVPGSFDIELPFHVGIQPEVHPEYLEFVGQSNYIFPQLIKDSSKDSFFSFQREEGALKIGLPEKLKNHQNVEWIPYHFQSSSRLSFSRFSEVMLIQSLSAEDDRGLLRFTFDNDRQESYALFISPLSSSLEGEKKKHSLQEDSQDFEGFFWLALLLAFVGGFILNAMPCVLPVLSLKLMSFVKQAQDDHTHPFFYGFSFTCGVLVSFWLLSLTLILLRYYGLQVGWGFQMQSFSFVLAVFLLLVMFSYNLFGFYEIGQSLMQLGASARSRSHLYSSFLSGIFATIVATPCTAPFMGSALGYALTVPWYLSILIFTFLGLGLSFPYLVLSAFPSLLKWIPRPGQWMVSFKKAMGFLLLFSSLWMLWQLALMTHSSYLIFCLIICILLAVFCLIYGYYSRPNYSSLVRRFNFIFFLFVIGGSYWKLVDVGLKSRVSVIQEQSDWRIYDPVEVDRVLSEGSHVFINLTARWCATCQVNKSLVLNKDFVKEAFLKKGVVLFEGDWTERDDKITQLLEKYHRAGVPFYLLIDANDMKDPIVLPEVLSEKLLLEHIKNLSSVESLERKRA